MVSNYPGGELVSWMIYSISGLMAIVCLGVIARSLLIPAAVRRGAACGACRHELVDTATNRCPECGGLLTKVGVTTPALAIRLRGGLGWALLAWTAICGAGTRYVFSYVQMLTWQSQSSGMNSRSQIELETHFTPTFRGRGFSGDDTARPNYSIESNTVYLEDKAKGESNLKEASLVLRAGAGSSKSVLTIDGAGRKFTVKGKDNAVVAEGPIESLDEAAIKSWFAGASLDTADARVARGMADILEITRTIMSDPSALEHSMSIDPGRGATADGALTANTSGSSSGPAPVTATAALWQDRVMFIVPGVALLVYAAGAALIAMRHRRLLR